jgi:hypothetical protein
MALAKTLGGDIGSLVQFISRYHGRKFSSNRIFTKLIQEDYPSFLRAQARSDTPRDPNYRKPDAECRICRGQRFVHIERDGISSMCECPCTTADPAEAARRQRRIEQYRT